MESYIYNFIHKIISSTFLQLSSPRPQIKIPLHFTIYIWTILFVFWVISTWLNQVFFAWNATAKHQLSPLTHCLFLCKIYFYFSGILMVLWKESLNRDGQQFYYYQQNEKKFFLTYIKQKKPRYIVGNPGVGQVQRCSRAKNMVENNIFMLRNVF